MNFEFTEEQKMFQKTIRDFADKEMAPLVDEAEAKEEFPINLYRKMGELGFLGIGLPEKYGGAGMGLTGECIFKDEMSRVCAGITQSIMLMPPNFFELATEEQRQRNFLPYVKGEKLWGIALTEPNAGSDAAAMQTTATKDGDSYILNGEKIFTTNGSIGDFIILLTLTDKSKGARGMSAFVLEKDTPGFTAQQLHKFGLHSAVTGQEFFDNCRIPRENLIGEEGRGFYYFMEALDRYRAQYAAQSVGIAQVAYEASVSYAKQRVQFGQPIGTFQANSLKLVNMDVMIEAARLLVYKAAWLADQGQPYTKEAAAARYYCSEMVMRVTTDALQIQGGYGMMVESPLHRYFRDAKFFSVMLGTAEICAVVVARAITGLR